MYTISVPARLDAFVRLRAFVEESCAGAGVPRPFALRVLLLVEELFVNTVTHGYGRDCDEPVQVTLTVTPVEIAVEYEDECQPYDLFAAADAARDGDDADDLDARRVGGFGVRFITAMADDVGYARLEGRNRISFRLAPRG